MLLPSPAGTGSEACCSAFSGETAEQPGTALPPLGSSGRPLLVTGPSALCVTLPCSFLASQGKPSFPGLLPFTLFSSVTQSCPTLCDPMDCSTPGLPVHHQLPEFAQTHVHRLGDAIQPSHPLSSPSPAFNLSQHQCLFQ